MSYQVLARKWRPRNFQEMAGQTHVLKTLINALDNDRLHHAYLFTGTRGVGKTTIARILARCLNCETGITSTPCGECSACKEISEGRFIDLIEVDAASRTKVEDTRELLENVQYAPSRGRFKVYLIDEVHMLSTHSFNALLKTLEEPPPHVKFLLATTDPQKLPVTVLSRCLQFNLKNLSPELLVDHLKHILREEKIEYEEGALWQLGRAAQGSARDCLTLLDQAIGFCDGKLTDQGLSEFLGNLDRAVIAGLMDALVAQDAAGVLQLITEAAENSPDFAVILQELLSWLHRVAIAQVLPDAIDNAQGDRAQILAHAAALPAETVQLYYQLALKGREDMPFALDARSGLEMTLLRMLAFTPAGIPQPPSQAIPSSSQSSAPTDNKPAAQNAQETVAQAEQKKKPLIPEVPLSSTQSAQEQIPPQQEKIEPVANPASLDLISVPVTESSAPTQKIQKERIQEAVAPVPSEQVSLDKLASTDWIAVFSALDLSGVTRNIAGNTILQEVDGAKLTLCLDERNATIFNDDHRGRIEQALSDYFGAQIKLTIKISPVSAETPAAYRHRKLQEYQAQAMLTFSEDPLVLSLLNEFDAEIRINTVKPINELKL